MRVPLLTLAALSASAAGPCVVDQVRLALAAEPSSMTVVWATGNTSTPAGYVGVVAYGAAPGALTSTSAPGDSRNYTIDKQGSPFLHMAALTGLTPGARVYYQIVTAPGSPACAPSAVLNFTATPAVGDARAFPIRVASYGDMGISHSKNTAAFLAELAAAGSVDLIVHAGDISYAGVFMCEKGGWGQALASPLPAPTPPCRRSRADNRGATDRDGGYENVQNTYYNEVSPYQSLVPAMYSSGNVRQAPARRACASAGAPPHRTRRPPRARAARGVLGLGAELPRLPHARGADDARHGGVGLAVLAQLQLWPHPLPRL
jgi:hypothetical protein